MRNKLRKIKDRQLTETTVLGATVDLGERARADGALDVDAASDGG